MNRSRPSSVVPAGVRVTPEVFPVCEETNVEVELSEVGSRVSNAGGFSEWRLAVQ